MRLVMVGLWALALRDHGEILDQPARRRFEPGGLTAGGAVYSLIPTRVLVVTDAMPPAPELLAAMAVAVARATLYEVQFQIVVLNPARAEVHVLHPERRDEVEGAARALDAWLAQVHVSLSGTRVTGFVSVRHDPMDAIEEVLSSEPVHEIWLYVAAHPLARRLHQDLPHRLAHFDLPVRSLATTSHTVHHR